MVSTHRRGGRTLALAMTLIICLSLSLTTTLAQVSVTQQTAGVGPTPQPPQFPSGLNGLSTGQTNQFTEGGTGPSPAGIPLPSNTLTGAALSAYEASIATNAAQAKGTNFGYETTTGNAIDGVAATLSGGFDEQVSSLGSPTPESSTSSAPNAAQDLWAPQGFLALMLSLSAAVMGAAWVL